MPESKDDDDDDDEEGPGLTKKRKKKAKTGKRGARKRAEAEAKAAASQDGDAVATEGDGGADEGGAPPSQESLFKKANDAKNEAKLKEALAVQRQDRMAQVRKNISFKVFTI